MEAAVSEPRKFKLRRVNPDQDIIQKNLEPLKQNIQKKKKAQEAYYENHVDLGMSPLVRDFNKRPVHQRLGRRIPFNGTNTSAIPPKRRLRLPGSQSMKRTRIFTAQQRLNRIRANQREVLNANVPKRIKLRRTLPQQGGPTNLRVQVRNSNAFVGRQQNGYRGFRRFRQILNYKLQQEIKKIQMEFEGTQIIAPFSVTPASTNIPMHKRFGQLS